MSFFARMDRTSFRIQTHEEEEHTKAYKDAAPEDRLAIASYLTKSAYGLLQSGFPPMDKRAFAIRHRK